MKRKWLKKRVAVLLAVAMALTLFAGINITTLTAYAAPNTAPTSGYWTDVEGLKEFNLSSSTAIGKIRFGLNNGSSRIWAICGTDGNDLALLSTSAFATGRYGDTSEYSKSDFVQNLITGGYLSTTYFSAEEQVKMADVTVSTNEPDGSSGHNAVTVANKKLYLPNSADQNSSGLTVTTIYVGSGNNIAIDLGKLTDANGFQTEDFWLRSPNYFFVDSALVASPDDHVYGRYVNHYPAAAVPAFNLNLTSVIFASAANAASSDGKLMVTENTYTLRYASTTDENGKISKSGEKVQVKNAAGKFLVAQNNDGAYAKQITKDDETVTAKEMGAGNFNDCKVWIESTDADRITTATRIVDTVDAPVLTVNSITKTYDGNPVADSEIKGTAKDDGENISGTWKFEAGQQLTNVQDSGEKKVIFTPTDTDMYESAQGTLQLTINKAKPTGSPKFTKITEAGKTLADAALVKSATTPENGFNVPGTVEWDDDDNTVVEADKAYCWTFTPNDENNYETVQDSVIVYETGSAPSPTPTPSYRITDGAKSTWAKGSNAALTFKGDGALEDFVSVKVDGKVIDKENYTVKAGSTVITLKASYLNTLTVGEHTLEMAWKDGSASTTFTVKAATSTGTSSSPKTGDTENISIWLLLMISAGGIMLVCLDRRKKNYSK